MNVVYIEHKSFWGNDTPRNFYLILYSDISKDVSDYKTYIDDRAKYNNYENNSVIYSEMINANKIAIYYTYNMKRDGKPCELEEYIRKHGRRKIKLLK